jgi:hypothetical protein
MTDEPDTTVDHFDLVDLTIDGKLVEFSSAIVTQESTWVGSGEREHTVRHWYGDIVSNDLGLDPARLHTLVARSNAHILRGFFRISRTHLSGLDINGSGALILTSSKHGAGRPLEGTPAQPSRV